MTYSARVWGARSLPQSTQRTSGRPWSGSGVATISPFGQLAWSCRVVDASKHQLNKKVVGFIDSCLRPSDLGGRRNIPSVGSPSANRPGGCSHEGRPRPFGDWFRRGILGQPARYWSSHLTPFFDSCLLQDPRFSSTSSCRQIPTPPTMTPLR
jgi:hypothetical protein